MSGTARVQLSAKVFAKFSISWNIHPIFQKKNLFHTNTAYFKFITNTELIHRSVVYGRSAYPKRPNDPRVPSNPKFGITYLDKQPELSTDQSIDLVESEQIQKKNKISKAMKAYLERAQQHNRFIKEREEEFEVGRRHLANMMGLKFETLTQNDIDIAIKYLMPSGLFDHRARPKMKPPSEIYPSIKQAQFNSDGRPFHSFFYTGRPNFYQTCYDLEENMEHLNKYENNQLQSGIFDPPNEYKIDLTSSVWLTYNEMKTIFLEKIEESKYDAFIVALERLALHPYSKLFQDFLMKFRKEIKAAIEIIEIPKLKYDENGRPYMNAVGRRKLCVAYVTVRGNGTGKVDINGKDILYFDFIHDREQVMTPLKFCGLLNKVDIECRTTHLEYTREYSEDAPPFPHKVRELGTSAQSGAIRYALSMALRSFVDRDTLEKMRLVGLLTPDRRIKLRKIWGQEGARRKYTWKKR